MTPLDYLAPKTIVLLLLKLQACYRVITASNRLRDKGNLWVTGILVMLRSMGRILGSSPLVGERNLRAEPQKLERASARFTLHVLR